MRALVKMPHIDIEIKGTMPRKLLLVLKELYGKNVNIINDGDDETVDVFTTEWYRKIDAASGPGDAIRVNREIRGMTQDELGRLLGGISRQNVSHMERGVRPISLKTAKKMAGLFKVPLEYFIKQD